MASIGSVILQTFSGRKVDFMMEQFSAYLLVSCWKGCRFLLKQKSIDFQTVVIVKANSVLSTFFISFLIFLLSDLL